MGHIGRIPLAPIFRTEGGGPDYWNKPQRIGVYDYDSLTKLLEVTWKRLFDSPPRDPQDIIQGMEAEIMTLRAAASEEYEP